MKKIILFILAFFAAFVGIGVAQKKVVKAVYTHDFPKEMVPHVKEAYTKLFEKGKILYGINCAKCHNTIVKGVEVMPEFTKEHLAQYELRLQNPKHEEELTEMRVNAEELQQITIFLTYYKKAEPAPGKKN
jgi:reverse gyrase